MSLAGLFIMYLTDPLTLPEQSILWERLANSSHYQAQQFPLKLSVEALRPKGEMEHLTDKQ